LLIYFVFSFTLVLLLLIAIRHTESGRCAPNTPKLQEELLSAIKLSKDLIFMFLLSQ